MSYQIVPCNLRVCLLLRSEARFTGPLKINGGRNPISWKKGKRLWSSHIQYPSCLVHKFLQKNRRYVSMSKQTQSVKHKIPSLCCWVTKTSAPPAQRACHLECWWKWRGGRPGRERDLSLKQHIKILSRQNEAEHGRLCGDFAHILASCSTYN